MTKEQLEELARKAFPDLKPELYPDNEQFMNEEMRLIDLRSGYIKGYLDATKEKVMKPRIYISGPISGLNREECIAKFKDTQRMLENLGFEVFNPKENGLPEDAKSHDHMRRDLSVLTNELNPFTHIFMMNHWTHSAGCWKEFETAISCGIAVIFEEMSLEAGIKSVGKYCGVKFE